MAASQGNDATGTRIRAAVAATLAVLSAGAVGSCASFFFLSGLSSLLPQPTNSVQQFSHQGMMRNLHEQERVDNVAAFPRRLSAFRGYELVLTAGLIPVRGLPWDCSIPGPQERKGP